MPPSFIPLGLCQCGCGEKTTIATRTENGYRQGEPKRFIVGHYSKTPEHRALRSKLSKEHIGKANPNWKGGKITYRRKPAIYAPDHPNARGRYVMESRYVASEMLGRALTDDEVVWHKDGDETNNAPDNLEVISADEQTRRANAARHHPEQVYPDA